MHIYISFFIHIHIYIYIYVCIVLSLCVSLSFSVYIKRFLNIHVCAACVSDFTWLAEAAYLLPPASKSGLRCASSLSGHA